MASIDVKVPDIGDFAEVAVIEVMVKVGDAVKAEQSLITVESDKASMEIPSSHAGIVKALKVAVGDKVAMGSVIVELEAAASAESAPVGTPAPVRAEPSAVRAEPVEAPASPSTSSGRAEGGAVTVVVPDIGDFDEVAVIELFVKAGDSVKVEQSLITVESDKASMEIPSSHAGTVAEVLVKVGDKVAKGTPIVVMQTASSPSVRAEPVPVRAEPAEAPASPSTGSGRTESAVSPSTGSGRTEAHAVPAHQPTTAP
ncbi:MAG: hypothetical protein RL227_1610, partial [Pseudomonadota bacterium]